MVAQKEFDTMFQDATFHERIREITFDGDTRTFQRLFDHTPYRPLRLVSLSFTNWFTCYTPRTPLTPVESIAPCLERLHIVDLHFDLGFITGTRNLTHLSLIAKHHSSSNSDKLLAVLQANPFLEYLRFIGFRDPPPGDGFSPIPLPHLRTIDMRVCWTMSQLSRFFERLRLSANIEEIKLTTETNERRENLAWILNAVYSQVRHLLIRKSPPCNIVFHYCKYLSDNMSLPQIAPFLILGSDDILDSPLHHHLGELEKYNVLSNLSHLEVMIFQRKPHLKPVFEVTKTLEKLTWNHCFGFFNILHQKAVRGDANGASNMEAASSTSPARVRLLLPALRELTIIEEDFRSSDPDTSRSQLKTAILSCFRARRQHGSHLEILKLIACHYVDPVWVEELEEVGGQVRQWFPGVFRNVRSHRASSNHRERDESLVSPQSSDSSSDEEREDSESEWTGTSDDEENYFLLPDHVPEE